MVEQTCNKNAIKSSRSLVYSWANQRVSFLEMLLKSILLRHGFEQPLIANYPLTNYYGMKIFSPSKDISTIENYRFEEEKVKKIMKANMSNDN